MVALVTVNNYCWFTLMSATFGLQACGCHSAAAPACHCGYEPPAPLTRPCVIRNFCLGVICYHDVFSTCDATTLRILNSWSVQMVEALTVVIAWVRLLVWVTNQSDRVSDRLRECRC